MHPSNSLFDNDSQYWGRANKLKGQVDRHRLARCANVSRWWMMSWLNCQADICHTQRKFEICSEWRFQTIVLFPIQHFEDAGCIHKIFQVEFSWAGWRSDSFYFAVKDGEHSLPPFFVSMHSRPMIKKFDCSWSVGDVSFVLINEILQHVKVFVWKVASSLQRINGIGLNKHTPDGGLHNAEMYKLNAKLL